MTESARITGGYTAEARAVRVFRFSIVLIAAIMVGTATLSPEADRFWPKVVGPAPFGVPAKWVVGAALIAWCVPYWWVCRHAAIVCGGYGASGLWRRWGWFALPVFLVAVLRFGDRDERRSAAVTIGGLAYCFVSFAVWITCTAWRGI